MNYLSKSIIITLSILIFGFLIFSTFFIDGSKKLENMDLSITGIGKYEVMNKDNKFILTNIENNFDGKTILDQITKTSRIFVIDGKYNRTGTGEKININIKKGLYLFDIKETSNHISIITDGFKIENLGIGKFFINLNDSNKVLIYSIDSVLDLSLVKTNKELITNINLYPNVYFLLNINKIDTSLSSALKNSDALKISKILNLNYYNDKIYNDEGLVKDYILNLFTIRNIDYKEFVNTSLGYIYYDYVKNINYKLKTLQIGIIPEYLSKYFYIFKNNEKKEVYYKNIIFREIINLLNETKINLKLSNDIINHLEKLNIINTKDKDKIIDIIYYCYLSSFKNLFNNNLVNENFGNLISKIENSKYETKKSDLILKNIYYKYNFILNKNIFENINLFIDQYLKDYILTKNNIDYILSYIGNLTKSTKLEENNLNTENIIISLSKYIDILTNYSDSNIASNIKTTVYNVTEILNSVYSNILNNYFEKNKNNNGLLVRNSNKIQEKNLDEFIKSIKELSIYIESNLKKIINDKNTEVLINEYEKIIINYDEILLALKDEDQYNKKYNKSYNIFDKESIYIENKEDLIDDKNKIINYLLNFNGMNLNSISINPKNKFYCDYPIDENFNGNLETYCFEIKDLVLTNENNTSIKLNFLFFPYENNKINNIVIIKNGETKNYSRTYDLNSLKEEFEKKELSLEDEENINKYNFNNFFILTFNDSVIASIKNNETTEITKDFLLNEDKSIKTFKRNKLLGDKGDFAILNGFLNIKYDELKVTQDNSQNFIIEIIDSLLTYKNEKGNENQEYSAIFNSKYIFYPNHSFKNIKLKFIDLSNSNIGEKKYLLGDNIININSIIEITKIKEIIEKLLYNIANIDNIIKNIKYINNSNKINIEYLDSEDITKFSILLNNKELDIFLQYGKIIEIYYNGNSMINNSINIGELQNFLNNLN